MPFDIFAKKFEASFKEGVKVYNKKYPTEPIPDPLPCYIMRIFPSEYGMKMIMSETDLESRPIELVRILLQESLSRADEAKLLSLIQSARTGPEGFKAVIRTIIDHPASSILTIVGSSIAPFVDKSGVLGKWFESKGIDQTLLSAYSSEKLSDLCVKIANSDSSNSASSLFVFKARLRKNLPQSKKLSPEELGAIDSIVYKRLKSIGVGLIA
jgi:hypothetical protein